MDEANSENSTVLPPEIQARLERFRAMLGGLRVLAIRRMGRDWAVDLADESGEVVSQLLLMDERTYDETHGAQPRIGPGDHVSTG